MCFQLYYGTVLEITCCTSTCVCVPGGGAVRTPSVQGASDVARRRSRSSQRGCGGPKGGRRESSQFALGQIGVRRGPISPACMRGFCGEAAAVLVPLAVASESDRLAWRASEWGRLPGGRGRGQRQPLGVVLVGAPRSEGGGTCSCPLGAHPPALNRSGCCDDCPESWMTRTGLPACAWEPCRVGTPWVACGGSDACVALLPSGRTAGPARGCQSLW